MKYRAFLKYATITILMFLLFTMFCSEVRSPDGNYLIWVTFYLREYGTEVPVANTSLSFTLTTSLGTVKLGPWKPDDTGRINVFLGEFSTKALSVPPRLVEISLTNDYLLIKIGEVFIEDIDGLDAQYDFKEVRYRNIQVNLPNIMRPGREVEILDNKVFVKMSIWVLKGKIVSISDRDPLSGKDSAILVKPSAKVISVKVENKTDICKHYYFVPINYNVLIVPRTTVGQLLQYKNFRVTVDENVSFIHWMYYAASHYVDEMLLLLRKEINWLKSSGLPVDQELEEYNALNNLATRTLSSLLKEEYTAALNGMRIFANRVNDLNRWLVNLKNLSIVGTILIVIFAYCFSSLLSAFIFEEPTRGKTRLVIKILLFVPLTILFALIDPSSRLACIMLVSGSLGSPVFPNDVQSVLLGMLVFDALLYFLIAVITVKKSPVTDLALQMGIRGLKRRASRSILTLITIAIVVSSSVLFVNISIARGVKVKSSWFGTQFPSIIVRSEPLSPSINIYDVDWIRTNEWCMNVSYFETINEAERIGSDTQIFRTGMIRFSTGSWQPIALILIDPAFMNENYNFSIYVRGFWREFSPGENVVLLPTTYNVAVGDYVTLGVDETIVTAEGGAPLGTRILGIFRVVGKFDLSQILEIRKPDNTPLFKESAINVVLAPIGSIKDPAIHISEVIAIVKPEYNPITVASEVSYSLGLPVIANSNGISFLVAWSIEVSVTGLIQSIVPLIIAGLIMYVSINSIFEERRREMLTLATLGMDPRNTLISFIIETILYGLLGTLTGFFGVYVTVSFLLYLERMLNLAILPLQLSYSTFTIFVALFTGVFMVFLGGYVPSIRAQGLSLMGRAKEREIFGELIEEGDIVIFPLPIRESIQNSELVYTYVKENVTKMPSSLIDRNSIKGEIRRDGTFNVSFIAFGPGRAVTIPCEIKGERKRDVLALSVAFPKGYRSYGEMGKVLRNLESSMIGFSVWRDMQIKAKIIREAPKKEKTVEEIIEEAKGIIEQIKEINRKIKMLDSQKDRLMEETYNEFRQRYVHALDEKYKILRSITIGLEQYLAQFREEIRKINLEIERNTIAYNLGEINEEEYVRICSPLQNRIANLKSKAMDLEEIFEFLKKPSGVM
ncbi:MAG: FtsX-like permease family protein [Nitrososphaerota archaeon]